MIEWTQNFGENFGRGKEEREKDFGFGSLRKSARPPLQTGRARMPARRGCHPGSGLAGRDPTCQDEVFTARDLSHCHFPLLPSFTRAPSPYGNRERERVASPLISLLRARFQDSPWLRPPHGQLSRDLWP